MLVTSQALAGDPGSAGCPAIRHAGEVWSYAALRDRAAMFDAGSARWPVRPDAGGRFAALLGEWTPDFLAAFLGLAGAGWAVGVLDPGWTGGELQAALDQLDPDVVLVAADLAPREIDAWAPIGEVAGWRVRSRTVTGEPAGRRAPRGDDAFYVGFTSGSSGRPKAFVRSHRSWWESFIGLDGLCPIDGGTVLVPGPLSGSHFLFGALHALHAGATVALIPPTGLGAALGGDADLAAMYVVPSMLAQLADTDDDRAPVCPRHIFCAGARLEPEVRAATEQRFAASRLVEYYGASELSFVAIHLPGDGTPAGAVGRAFPGVEITIRDETDRPVAAGETGVIFVRSALVFAGYRGTPPASAARTAGDGWWTVGDRGHLDAGGNLFVAGRGSGLIITGGANVQPEEVEAAVAAARGVRACAVVGVPDPRWGEIVCAVIVPDGQPARAEVRDHVAARLAPYKRPRRYFTVDSLPLGRTGKVDRGAARELVAAGRLAELR